MKKSYYLIAAILVLSTTSMILTRDNEDQKKTAPFRIDDSRPQFQKGMITIKVKKGVGEFDMQRGKVSFNISSLDEKAAKYKVDLLEKRFKYNPEKLRADLPDLSRIYRIEFPEEYPITKVAREFAGDPNIEYAEPIPIPYSYIEPDDPRYGQCQHLPQIRAPQAWDIHKGEDGFEEVVIAIVDDGVDWDHEDLVDNIWQNMGEDIDGDWRTLEFIGDEWVFDPGDVNGIDDDGNGYIDDFIGWNFHNSGNNPDHLPGNGHGSHCAGLASATTNNNIGVASISWNLKIMPVQAAGEAGGIIHAYNGIIYAAENGADVISNSYGIDYYSQADFEVISYAIGLGSILVASAGNDNQFTDHHYPSNYPGVISVASVVDNDYKASFSNFGPNISISSPGDGIYSTTKNNTYSRWSGTSMSSPLAAGLFGLVKSYHPEWTSEKVITQVLATADNIDTINTAYKNMLGSGRINAFKALDITNITLEQEIALNLLGYTCHDTDGNNMLEPGDTVSMSFEMRNYSFGVSADNVTFKLISDDPCIAILENSFSGIVPADNYFNLDHVFQFKISDQATSHFTSLKLVTSAEAEITWGDTLSFQIIIAPDDILVFQGSGTGNAYSGDSIYQFLIEQDLPVSYTTHFPYSLNGFDAVFLSFGNYGQYINMGTIITLKMTETISEYLVKGGRVYADCGSFFGGMAYFGYPNLEEMIDLFGIKEVETPLGINALTMLNGLPGSIGEDLKFVGSSQAPNWYIDILTPGSYGISVFEEQNYGVVAVQGEGEYGQKTFVFSYSLAHLEDTEYGTRDELLNNIVAFFDLYNPVADFSADTTIIAAGDTVYFTDLSSNNPTSWEWEFEGGTPETSTAQNPVVVYNNTGTFDVTLIVYNEYGSDTLLIPDYINHNLGIDPVAGLNPGDVKIYPVPANDKLFISSILNINTVDIINCSGRLIKSIAFNSKETEIDISAIPDGIYLIRFRTENLTGCARFVVAR